MDLIEPKPFRPVNLMRSIEQMRSAKSEFDLERDKARRGATQKILGLLKSDQQPLDLTRIEVRALRDLIKNPPEDSEDVRSRAIKWALALRSLSWRDRWDIWCATDDDDLGRKCAESMQEHLRLRPKAKKHWPAWLQRDRVDVVSCLRDPQPVLRAFVAARRPDRRPDLTQFTVWSGIPLTTKLGVRLAVDLVKTVSGSVWREWDPEQLRQWAKERDIAVQSAVIDRQLCELGGNAKVHSQIPESPERRSLMAFVDDAFGHPDDHPLKWKLVSERARELFRMLHLGDEIAKIMKRFGQDAERARYDFWRQWTDSIGDAKFVMAGSVGVCMMVIGFRLFIEFGTTNHALYIYESPREPLRRLLPDRVKYKVEDFRVPQETLKRRHQGITKKVGTEQVKFVQRISHNQGWQQAVGDALLESLRLQR